MTDRTANVSPAAKAAGLNREQLLVMPLADLRRYPAVGHKVIAEAIEIKTRAALRALDLGSHDLLRKILVSLLTERSVRND
ncbi:MAG: hypothetical protein J2P48_08375 [Alphaproteobacteria bacterium]|nr:hypothetical protein [Alphaproteobacteria bacterium]